MLRRYRQSIYMLTDKLRALQSDPENMPLLFDLQKALLTKIKRTDARIAKLKTRRGSLVRSKKSGQSREQSRLTKKAITKTDAAIADARQLLFFWRCFGDGIAFIYIDKYALKHMLYNTHNYSIKPAAGAILGKAGLRREWAILKTILSKEMPAILCDLTNTIRHGDICLLIGPDPYPIEVKTSKNRNARVDRQIENIAALNEFLRADMATNFRGLNHVVRISVPAPNNNHASTMNECIEKSRETGFATISPEAGLNYICARSAEAASHLAPLIKPKTIVNILNETKSEAAWMPYLPFVLSIHHKEDLYDFMNCDITLMILLDAQALIDAYAARGLEATFVDHPDITLVVTRQGHVCGVDPTGGISTGYFARIFLDFDTIQSFIDVELANIEYLESQSPDLIEKSGVAYAIPDNPAFGNVPEFTPMTWPVQKQRV